jgi:hypothetical protein
LRFWQIAHNTSIKIEWEVLSKRQWTGQVNWSTKSLPIFFMSWRYRFFVVGWRECLLCTISPVITYILTAFIAYSLINSKFYSNKWEKMEKLCVTHYVTGDRKWPYVSMRDYPYILQVQLRSAMRESLKELIPLWYSM